MILDGKKVADILDEYEKDLFHRHIALVLGKSPDGITIITAAQVEAVREIRNRLGIPEIKA